MLFRSMKIKPEVSSVKETLTTAAGTRVPIVETSQSETVVKVKDGCTLVIAGLLKHEDIDEHNGLPGLSSLPVVGSLFGTKNKEKNKTEFVVFITPTIISGATNTSHEVNNESK